MNNSNNSKYYYRRRRRRWRRREGGEQGGSSGGGGNGGGVENDDDEASLPTYGAFADNLFLLYDEVYLLGDLHNNERGLLRFLLLHDLVHLKVTAAATAEEEDGSSSLLDLKVAEFKKNVLLVFLGDVIGKMKKDSSKEYSAALQVLSFIEKHKKHCLLVLGNHEMRFLSRTTPVDDISNFEITNMILKQDYGRTDLLTGSSSRKRQQRCNNNNKHPSNNTNTITNLYIQLENIMENLKDGRQAFFNDDKRGLPTYTSAALTKEYGGGGDDDNDDSSSSSRRRRRRQRVWIRFVLIAFILQFGEFLVYFVRLRVYMFHGGLDFTRDMSKQQSSKICNTRTHTYYTTTSSSSNNNNKRTKLNEWYKTGKEKCKDTTFLFAHDSDLCFEKTTTTTTKGGSGGGGGDGYYRPYVYHNDNKNNDFVCLDTNFYKSEVLSYIQLNPHINRYRYNKCITFRKEPVLGYYKIDIYN